ncbi:MAG: hypothetical protein EAZ30_12830 [Betaproteobacteria bacterium]|nr:MAG: hypothetical protein EAZ30_12830 [Betaproteobacteria bacterium]
MIDPLLASTYLGGSGFEQITAMAIHPASGEVYVVGTTSSLKFPQTLSGGQASATGTACFISRYSADLSRLIQSSYVGNGDVRCTSLALSAAGDDVYVAGWATARPPSPLAAPTERFRQPMRTQPMRALGPTASWPVWVAIYAA